MKQLYLSILYVLCIPLLLQAQTVNVNSGLNNANIDSITFMVFVGTDSALYIQKNPLPGTSSPGGNIPGLPFTAQFTGTTPIIIKELSLNGGSVAPYANDLGIRIANINPKLGTSPPVTAGNYRVVLSTPSSGLTLINSTNNLPNFEIGLKTLFGSLNMRSKMDVAGSISGSFTGEFDFDAQLSYSGIPDEDFLFVAERDGNSQFTAQALNAAGNLIGNPVCFGCGVTSGNTPYDWNSGFAFTANNAPQAMVFTVTPISTFFQNNPSAAEPVFGFRFALAAGGGPDINFFLVSTDPFTNNPINPFFGGVRGRVFNELNLLNNPGIQSVNANQLYINLVDSTTGLITGTSSVEPNGEYRFSPLEDGRYFIHLSINQGVIGQAPPTVLLPSGWQFDAEYNNSVPDNSANGIISIEISGQLLVSNIDFGILKTCDAGSDAPILIKK